MRSESCIRFAMASVRGRKIALMKVSMTDRNKSLALETNEPDQSELESIVELIRYMAIVKQPQHVLGIQITWP